MTATIDQTRPADGSKWVFDSGVASVFDNMLARSIPGHDTMRQLVLDLGSRFVQDNTDVVDLGCSRGAALQPFVDRFGNQCRYVGLDESGPMIDAARQRFAREIDAGFVRILDHDLRRGVPPVLASLTLAVLTLQFVPIEYRQGLVADVFRSTRLGGALIVVEKTLGPDSATQALFVNRYHALKRENGYTAEQVRAKAESLQGVLVPLTPEGNEQMLRAEGFKVSRFWQHLNFCGWLAIKETR
ncbi:MAG TPA: methyltransferase domain-containing protein [Tepidisphaeraceae bacterium]|nr:methyltransferase domain-containing protein [Tepidisphaeraceae bacterium]